VKKSFYKATAVMELPQPRRTSRQQQAKNGYWQNELDSLGIEPKQKTELNDNKEELENLADIIKQAMFHDYKMAYSEEGDAHKEEEEDIAKEPIWLAGE
jgi:hypothetical protein